MRLFIGIRAGCREYIGALQEQLGHAGRGRFTRTDNLHITLRFLGELPTGAVPGLCAAIAEAGGGALTLEVGGARMMGKNGIAIAEVMGDTDALAALANRLEAALENRGYARETRPFRAHITLVRDYAPRGDIGGIPAGLRRFTADEVVLFESRREQGQLVYAPLFAHRLEG
jgi:2'-5' RNA ligase